MLDIESVVEAWKPYVDSIQHWEELVDGTEPKDTPCGPVYELSNPIDRPGESFAIADMRNLEFAEPHHHIGGESEIYFVLKGLGLAVVGGQEMQIERGSVVVTPPDTSHFTIPESDLVIAVVNTPPFSAANVVVDTETNLDVGFSRQQFESLIN